MSKMYEVWCTQMYKPEQCVASFEVLEHAEYQKAMLERADYIDPLATFEIRETEY